MRTIDMGRSTPRDSPSSPFSSSSTRRQFRWRINKCPKEGAAAERKQRDDRPDEEKAAPSFFASSSSSCPCREETAAAAVPKKKRTASVADAAVSRLRSLLAAAPFLRRNRMAGLGAHVTGTLYGHRRGHVHLAFQADSKSCPVVLVELATATSALVREMASGLVRISLECERKSGGGGGGGEKAETTTATATATRLVEEPLWRAYVNGKKCGFAVQRDCGPADWKVLRAVEPVSMGAGVIPGDGGRTDRDVMYMRARFERVVGSKDSEAFYMMNPDSNGGPELSVYLLRI